MPNRPAGLAGINEPSSPERIAGAISAMRDSVWVINSEIEKTPSKEVVETVGRNVAHLELMLGKEEITEFDEDLSDVTEVITTGRAFQEEHKALLTEE